MSSSPPGLGQPPQDQVRPVSPTKRCLIDLLLSQHGISGEKIVSSDADGQDMPQGSRNSVLYGALRYFITSLPKVTLILFHTLAPSSQLPMTFNAQSRTPRQVLASWLQWSDINSHLFSLQCKPTEHPHDMHRLPIPIAQMR